MIFPGSQTENETNLWIKLRNWTSQISWKRQRVQPMTPFPPSSLLHTQNHGEILALHPEVNALCRSSEGCNLLCAGLPAPLTGWYILIIMFPHCFKDEKHFVYQWHKWLYNVIFIPQDVNQPPEVFTFAPALQRRKFSLKSNKSVNAISHFSPLPYHSEWIKNFSKL